MVSTQDTATTYEWFKDSNTLKRSGNINIDSSDMFSTLMISPIEESSAGNYTCLAKNLYGEDRRSAFLLVKGIKISFEYFLCMNDYFYKLTVFSM